MESVSNHSFFNLSSYPCLRVVINPQTSVTMIKQWPKFPVNPLIHRSLASQSTLPQATLSPPWITYASTFYLKHPSMGGFQATRLPSEEGCLCQETCIAWSAFKTSEDSSVNDIIDPPRSIIKYKIISGLPNPPHGITKQGSPITRALGKILPYPIKQTNKVKHYRIKVIQLCNLVQTVRLKCQTCDVTNNKNETQAINKYRKWNQNIPLAIVMKELLYFGSSKLSLSL